jgi:hypothetical protein
MAANKQIYDQCRADGIPVIIIEVGNLFRNRTWRISINHINSDGIFGNDMELDFDRPKKLGISLKPINTNRRSDILIATQHSSSLQWQNMPPMHTWVNTVVSKIRQYSTRKIVVRPHPRSPISSAASGVVIEVPKKMIGTYDDYNMSYDYHCVINYNSGPAVQAAINGTPVICDSSSLAGELSSKLENIENPILPDRTEWFLKLCHTEWTTNEIAQGIPLQRLLPKIIEQIS